MKQLWRNNGLSLVLFLIFSLCWVGQFLTGLQTHNEDLLLHQQPLLSATDYLSSGHFIESTFENWESEFLQMALFVVLTACLYQRGSSESKPLPDEAQEQQRYPKRFFRDSPWMRRLYENSLSLALFFLFILSFAAHLYGGWEEENLKRAIAPRPLPPMSLVDFFKSSDFWFQSFQNWQSEFLSVGVVVVLSIFLRQKSSSQSKPVDMPHHKTKD